MITSANEQNVLASNILDSVVRDKDGRLIVPIMWNRSNSHLLGRNFNLCRKLLESNLIKLKRRPDRIKMVDDVISDQVSKGVVELIPNLNSFIKETPNCSFLGHMPIFKLSRETTKCRIVFLSNLSEKCHSKPLSLSHNQTIMTGPNLNKKLSTSILQLRFDAKLICFDLEKAFLQIGLPPIDQNRLFFVV